MTSAIPIGAIIVSARSADDYRCFLLFTYPDHFDQAFHLGALRELLRIADEVRVHPLNDSAQNPYPHLAPLLDALRADGVHVDTLAVESPTDRSDAHTLRLRRPAPPAGCTNERSPMK